MGDIDKFLEFAESLKLVRNDYAEVEGKHIIDDIYTDLLPNDGVINKVNLPRTTLLVGRKGTGKSTIFQKSQKEIDKNKKYLSLYIDVKSLYDNSTPTLPKEIKTLPESEELIKYLIYSNFIKEIILKTKDKLKKRLEKNYVINFLGLSELVLDEVFLELDEIEYSIDSVFKKLNATLITYFKNTSDDISEDNSKTNVNFSNEVLNVGFENNISKTKNIKKEFDNTLITYLDIKKSFIDNIVKIREILKIKNLFIYLDDYSEIDKYAQTLFMDWFIAPVNNLSDDFVKFKIASYPKRFYYGKLDNSKIDEISLDFFDAFYAIEKKSDVIDISRMEHLALDYTKRLLENRFAVYFPNNNWEQFFEMTPDKLYEILFNATMNTPRKMGYLLSYCYESSLIHGSKISQSAMDNAALRFYNEIVEKYFLVNEFICKPFEDKISNEHQYELINQIVDRQVSNKIIVKPAKDTSHFFINNELVYLLDNLELNGFVSTYNKIKDSINIFSTVYCLDYGLCKKFGLQYALPGIAKTNSHVLPPLFNFNNLIVDYFNSTQVIRCEKGHEFPYSEINEFKRFKMNCPTCMEDRVFSNCQVIMKFTELRQKFIEQEEKEKFQITFPEYLILNFLKLSQNSISYQRLSQSLDISPPTVLQIVEKLNQKGWTEMDVVAGVALQKELVKITSKGVRQTEKIEKLIENLKIEPILKSVKLMNKPKRSPVKPPSKGRR